MLVASASCCGFPAPVLLHCPILRSYVSTRFVLYHMLSCRPSDTDPTTTSVRLVVPTPRGWYSLCVDLAVDYLRERDVVLGAQCCRALNFEDGMPVVPDPSGPCPSSGALAWASSPRDGKPSLTLVAVCLLLVCVELQRGFTSRETCVVSAAPSGTVADDGLVSSSFRGQESLSSVAEGRVFALNVMYATRSLFLLNATIHISGLCTSPPSKAKRTSLRRECPTMHVHNQYQGARCEHAHRSLIVLQHRR